MEHRIWLRRSNCPIYVMESKYKQAHHRQWLTNKVGSIRYDIGVDHLDGGGIRGAHYCCSQKWCKALSSMLPFIRFNQSHTPIPFVSSYFIHKRSTLEFFQFQLQLHSVYRAYTLKRCALLYKAHIFAVHVPTSRYILPALYILIIPCLLLRCWLWVVHFHQCFCFHFQRFWCDLKHERAGTKIFVIFCCVIGR